MARPDNDREREKLTTWFWARDCHHEAQAKIIAQIMRVEGYHKTVVVRGASVVVGPAENDPFPQEYLALTPGPTHCASTFDGLGLDQPASGVLAASTHG
jgi:hypothetical protein